jgi:GNAT superfamily N-acetyltransferase
MLVRRAVPADLPSISRVADAAHWETYAGLLKPDTIGRLLARDFSPAPLRRRLLRGGVLVAEEGASVVGFVDAVPGPHETRLAAIAIDPAHRLSGMGSALIESVRADRVDHPLFADVLLGNLESERFYEALGFAPGEVFPAALFDEEVIERRWWLAPRAARLSDHRDGVASSP